jgi:hypothetical protein
MAIYFFDCFLSARFDHSQIVIGTPLLAKSCLLPRNYNVMDGYRHGAVQAAAEEVSRSESDRNVLLR